jgi:hypothetical protein
MAPYNNVKILETNLEREYFTKHGLHLNSSGKEYIALRLTMVVKSFLNKERMSPIRLQWKDNTTFSDLNRNNKKSYVSNCNAVVVPQSQPSTSPKETLGKESQESSASTDKTNENEEITTHPQPAKRQRKKPAPSDQHFLWTT